MPGSSRPDPAALDTAAGAASLPQVGGVVDGEVVALRLGYVGPDFARFAVRGGSAEPLHVDVLGEKYVPVRFGGDYHVVVEGPGGIRMELSGSQRGHAAAVDVQARHTERGLALELRNGGPHEVQLELRALAHIEHETHVQVAAGGALPLFWPAPHGHYDLEAVVAEDATFHRRILGKAVPGLGA
ncbi:DUF756 domain-containing protein [Saccharopolyspora sp. TS4A08]|uniref:DUF756 domain-containing protein n=1 Tax=Saccharopolyspora ipomoeae TaxID=3042027 RepID=A0ABT6PJY3_9PSEU|nr:phospholipase domain-containing protein [Saccharopolyspora sp. TS4A08]MDI2028307.1 DUF756 domain-containing protein [Saccharopolyspora sp. TS4A08]